MDGLKGLFLAVLACALLTLLSGCTTTKYIAVPSVSVDSVYADRRQRDSIYVLDSVYVDRWAQGDTVFVEKVVTKYKYKDRWRHDTVAVVRRDSVRVPYPVEKDLDWWEKTRMYSFPLLVAAVAILLLALFAIKRKQP